MKTQKNNNSKNNNNKVDVTAINATKYSCAMLEENIVQDKIITVNMSAIEKVDVMSMSRIAFFRKLIKLDTSFNTLALYDYRFYNKTNDRSKTQHNNKYQEQELQVAYVRMRTAKQLRDVLKEVDVVTYLNKKYNKTQKFYTVSEYKAIVS